MKFMTENGKTKAVGDAVSAFEVRPVKRITNYPRPPKSSITDQDRRNALTAAQEEVRSYSVQALAGIPVAVGDYTRQLANTKLTRRSHQKTATQGHRAYER